MARIVLEGDMENEREFANDLLPNGYRIVKLVEANFEVSAKGNKVIVTIVEDIKTGARNRFWLPTEERKRWLLRSLLIALDVYKKNEENKYDFDSDDLINREVGAFIFTVDEPYKTEDYKEATRKKNRIKRFMSKEEALESMKNLQPVKSEITGEEIPF
jgi:hypothetical protein